MSKRRAEKWRWMSGEWKNRQEIVENLSSRTLEGFSTLFFSKRRKPWGVVSAALVEMSNSPGENLRFFEFSTAKSTEAKRSDDGGSERISIKKTFSIKEINSNASSRNFDVFFLCCKIPKIFSISLAFLPFIFSVWRRRRRRARSDSRINHFFLQFCSWAQQQRRVVEKDGENFSNFLRRFAVKLSSGGGEEAEFTKFSKSRKNMKQLSERAQRGGKIIFKRWENFCILSFADLYRDAEKNKLHNSTSAFSQEISLRRVVVSLECLTSNSPEPSPSLPSAYTRSSFLDD